MRRGFDIATSMGGLVWEQVRASLQQYEELVGLVPPGSERFGYKSPFEIAYGTGVLEGRDGVLHLGVPRLELLGFGLFLLDDHRPSISAGREIDQADLAQVTLFDQEDLLTVLLGKVELREPEADRKTRAATAI